MEMVQRLGSAGGIMAKELVPIILSCIVWWTLLTRKEVLFQCENLSLVTVINKGYSKDKTVMHLLHCLWFFVAYFDIVISAAHLPGRANIIADGLSRNNLAQCFLTNPKLSRVPTPLPVTIFSLI